MNKFCTHLIKILNNVQIKTSHLHQTSTSIVLNKRFLGYTSDISLIKLYPNSKQEIFSPPPPERNDGKFSGYIPLDNLEITYSRSSGPGGQNVNCVNTKVDIRFQVETANWISDKVKARLLNQHKTKINKDGYLVMKSDATRSQQMNLAHALEKLRCIIREMEIETPRPTEQTIEKLRRRHEKASRERLIEKRERSQIKADRQTPSEGL